MLNSFVNKLLVILFLTEFVKGALLLSILPVYIGAVLGLSAYLVGWSLSLQYVGDNLFRSPIGWFIDRFGYRSCLLFGIFIALVSLYMINRFTEPAWIILGCALFGVGTSPLWPSVVTAATADAGEKTRGRMMSIVNLAWLLGFGLGPVLINLVVSDTYQMAFQLLSLLLAVVMIIALTLPHHLKEASDQHGKSAQNNSVHPWGKRVVHYWTELKQSITISKLMFPAMFLQTFALGLLTPIITLYARTELGLSPIAFSGFLLTGGAATVLLLIPVGQWVDKWGTQWFLQIGFAVSSLALLSFAYATSVRLSFILVAVLGMGYALIIPAWNTLMASAVPNKKRGAVWGFFLTIEGMGMIIGPIVSGRLWDSISPTAPFVVSSMVLFSLLIVHNFISSEKKVIVQ